LARYRHRSFIEVIAAAFRAIKTASKPDCPDLLVFNWFSVAGADGAAYAQAHAGDRRRGEEGTCAGVFHAVSIVVPMAWRPLGSVCIDAMARHFLHAIEVYFENFSTLSLSC
jgi:hypothetical protein